MSLTKYKNEISSAIKDVSWSVWNRQGVNGTGGVNRFSVDIEASIVMLAYAARLDERLYENAKTWLSKYGDIVIRERLSSLVKDLDDQWLFRFLGAAFESLDDPHWKGVIDNCRKALKKYSNKQKEELRISGGARGWKKEDKIFSSWGILKGESGANVILQDHAKILSSNALISYRYLIGATVRADIFYLYALSQRLKNKSWVNCISTSRLANLLGCYNSSIYRIERDFEKAGLLLKGGKKTDVWSAGSKNLMIHSQPIESGIINWIEISKAIIVTMNFFITTEGVTNEIILKSKLSDLQDQIFPLLVENGFWVPAAYGKMLGKLEPFTSDDLAEMISKSFQKMAMKMSG